MVLSRIVLLCVAMAFLAAGCGGADETDERRIVAAFYPLAFVAEEVAGEDVEVTNLTPPGAEPHDHELTPRDVGRLRDASLVLYVGGGFQPALEAAVDDRAGPSLDALDGLELLPDDPHFWLDPRRLAVVARQVASALGDEAGADELVARLTELDDELDKGLASCERRELVTSHAAFGYLADRYGLRQVALLGISPDAEPTPREIERLVREVRAAGATTVFAETLLSPALAETIAREAGAATAVLDPLEGLGATELDEGADYFTVMRENLAALREALGCT